MDYKRSIRAARVYPVAGSAKGGIAATSGFLLDRAGALRLVAEVSGALDEGWVAMLFTGYRDTQQITLNKAAVPKDVTEPVPQPKRRTMRRQRGAGPPNCPNGATKE